MNNNNNHKIVIKMEEKRRRNIAKFCLNIKKIMKTQKLVLPF